jgi:transposase
MKHSADKPSFMGADVASGHIDVALHGQQQVRRVANQEAALKGWLKTVEPGSMLALESTGRHHLLLARLAFERGLTVFVLNPRDVRHYAKGVGCRGKTDRLDAQVLARYVANEHAQLHAWQPPSPQLQRLDELLRQRAALMRHKTALAQSVSENRQMAQTLKPVLDACTQTLKALDRQLRRALDEVPGGASAARCITSVPGIGLLTGAALLRLFMRLGHVNADVAIAFTGLDPRPMDSGNKRGQRRLSKRGSPELRRLLFNAAMSASRTKCWNAAYQRERDKGLPSTAALIVLARKLVRVAYSLFKSGNSFNPFFCLT